MSEKYEITDAELEIMKILWNKKKCNINEIVDYLSVDNKKNKNTIKTLLHRLILKGAVESQKVNLKEVVYISKISEKKFLTNKRDSFIKNFFQGSTEKLLLNFVEDKKISKEELQKLINILNEKED